MNLFRRVSLFLLVVIASAIGHGEESWRPILRQMPLAVGSATLNRTNCLPILLGALQSNAVVRALVVLPGVSDDFYLLRRAQPLHLTATNLADALAELERTERLRVTFRDPLLLLHTAKDKLKPVMTSFSGVTTKALRTRVSAPHVLLEDRHWGTVQPWLAQLLGVKLTPEAHSPDAWHFARHNLAAWQLSDWDLICALSLSGGTAVVLGGDYVRFESRNTPPRKRPYKPPDAF